MSDLIDSALAARMQGHCLQCGYRVGWFRRLLWLHDVDADGTCGTCRELMRIQAHALSERYDRTYEAALLHVEALREVVGHEEGEEPASVVARQIVDRIFRKTSF